MNLLVINLDKGIFSPGSKSLERLKEYSQSVDKIFVIVWTKKKEQAIVFNDKLFIYPTNSCCRLFYYFDSFKIARKILKEQHIQLIFTQDPFETGLAGWRIARKNKIRLQLQIHTDFLSPYFGQESLFNKIRVYLGKFLIRRADVFRVVSARIKKSLVTCGIEQEKIFVLPIFVDIEKFESASIKTNLKQKYPQFDFIILMASRLSREKNIGLAIEAMSGIIKKYPKAGLVIVGEGEEIENLKFKIKNLILHDNVMLEPWTEDLASYYKSADIFLLTSNYEGWGLAMVEAMAGGCPIVMTDVGCAGELVVNNESGLVVPPGNKRALITALDLLLADESLREKFRANALAAAKKMPSKEQYLADYKKSWE
jgi:glycosyltransferase involved in cell wall biosynthesis